SKEVSVAAALDALDALDAHDAHDVLDVLENAHAKKEETAHTKPIKTKPAKKAPTPPVKELIEQNTHLNADAQQQTPAKTSESHETNEAHRHPHVPDVVNEPVVFPFDDDDDRTKAKRAKSVALASDGSKAKDGHRAATGEKPVAAEESEEKNSKAVIVINIIVVIAVLIVAGFALLNFAPDTGASQLLQSGLNKIFGDHSDDKAKEETKTGTTADGAPFAEPIKDGELLVQTEIGNNYNITKISYDKKLAYKDGQKYPIESAAQSIPIKNDYWTDTGQGVLLLDQSAVGAVIRYNSKLITFVNDGDTGVLAEVLPGSAAEQTVNAYGKDVTSLGISSLSIGDVRQNGQYLYVWTKEAVSATVNGKSGQQTSTKIYQLSTSTGAMLVCDVREFD
ncbi:MAG: hypothetical protein LBN35_02165, partial [Clostridiales Family XIII bacterium]|nr:hypothetical protein [Clostridiales Family XIII bacterium]